MQTINLDLSVRSIIPLLHAKQGDVGRKFKAILTDGGAAYPVPAGAAVSVWYSGASGEGNYTDIGADSAVSVSGNEITVELITQMLANYGDGELCLAINTADGDQIGTWNIPYMVEPLPGMGSAAAQAYFTAFSQAVENLPYPDTTLSVTGRAADAGAVGTALAGKAPAGYGLGTDAIELNQDDDLNTITKSGWYEFYFSRAPINTPQEWQDYANNDRWAGTIIRVDNYYGSSCMQTFYSSSNSEGVSGICAQRSINSNYISSPLEWVNPPMIQGVEYRTTERWNGKAVYTKLVNCGNLPANGERTVPDVLDASYKIIRCEGCTTDGWAMPVISDGDCRVTAFGSSVRFAATRDFSWMSANVTLWYTKD